MRERWDAVIIGAGLGGLLTAAILARRGKRVVVYERAPLVGGRLRSFDVDGYVIDAGAYLWPNLHLDDALAAAGCDGFRSGEIPLTRVLRVFVQGDGGRELPFPWPGYCDAETARVALRADPDTAVGLAALWERFAALSDAEVAALRHVPVREALPRFTSDARLVDALFRNVMLFGSIDPPNASMAECIGLRRRPPGRPPRPECAGANAAGGMRALPLALADACCAAGVTLRLGCPVERVRVERGRAVGIEVRDAAVPWTESVEADAVVCNAPIWTLFALIAPSLFPPDFVAAARACGVVGGVIAAAFAFDGLPTLRATGAADDFPGWSRLLTGPQAAFGGGYIWATLHSPANAPAGRHVLQAMRLSRSAEVADAVHVQRVHAAFRTMLDEVYSDVATRLVAQWAWTTRDGSEYMIHSAARPPIAAPGVDRLYFVGETTDVPAIQMDAAALSALRCADLLA